MIDGSMEVRANGRGNALLPMFHRGKFHDNILYLNAKSSDNNMTKTFSNYNVLPNSDMNHDAI